MIAENLKKSNIGITLGIIFETHGHGLIAANGSSRVIGTAILLIGIGGFVWGCLNYSVGKGYSPFLGFLGLLSCLGYFVLLFLPDKCKNGGSAKSGSGL